MKTTTKNIKWALKKYDISALKHQINAAKHIATLKKEWGWYLLCRLAATLHM